MQCPFCGEGSLVHQTKDMPYTYEGKSTVIPNVTGDFCGACGECVFTDKESKRIGDAILAFNREVSAKDAAA